MEKNRRQFLTWELKFAIVVELEERRNENLNWSVSEIGQWAQQKFNLGKIPHRITISRIKRGKELIKKLVKEEF